MADFNPDEYLGSGTEISTGFNPDEYLAEAKADEASQEGAARTTRDALRGAAQGASFGLSDEGTGVLEAVTDVASPQFQLKDFLDRYRARRDEARKLNAEASDRSPWAYGAGNLAGGLVVPGTGIAKGASTAYKLGKAGALGATMGFGSSNADLTRGDYTGALKDVGIGGAIGAGSQKLADMVIPAAKGAFSNIFGVNKTAVDDYLARAPELNTSKTKEVLKGEIDNATGALKGILGEAEESLANKRQSLSANAIEEKQALKEAYLSTKGVLENEAREGLGQASELVNINKQALKDAQDRTIQKVTEDLGTKIGRLKEDVSAGSKRAFEILKDNDVWQHGENLPTESGMEVISPTFDRILDTVDDAIKRLQVGGKAPLDDAGNRSIANLMSMKQKIAAMKNTPITYGDAKKLIQGLDRDLEGMYAAPKGTFAEPENFAKSEVRRILDRKLKRDVPAYAEQMESVSQDAKLLSQARDIFGDEATRARKLYDIEGPDQLYKYKALEGLGKRYDTDYISQLNQKNLPEYADYMMASEAKAAYPRLQQEAAAKQLAPLEDRLGQEFRPDVVKQRLEDLLAKSQEARSLEAAQAQYAPFKNLAPRETGASSAEPFINRMIGGKAQEIVPRIDDTAMVGNLKTYLPTIEQDLKNLRTMNAFTGQRTQGSRNVVTGGAIGSALGGLVGGPTGAASGAALGAGAGRFLDTQGPQMAKTILNKAYEWKGPLNQAMDFGVRKGPVRFSRTLHSLGLVNKATEPYVDDEQAKDQFLQSR